MHFMARSKSASGPSRKPAPKRSRKKALKEALRECNRRYGKMLQRLADGSAPPGAA